MNSGCVNRRSEEREGKGAVEKSPRNPPPHTKATRAPKDDGIAAHPTPSRCTTMSKCGRSLPTKPETSPPLQLQSLRLQRTTVRTSTTMPSAASNQRLCFLCRSHARGFSTQSRTLEYGKVIECGIPYFFRSSFQICTLSAYQINRQCRSGLPRNTDVSIEPFVLSNSPWRGRELMK